MSPIYFEPFMFLYFSLIFMLPLWLHREELEWNVSINISDCWFCFRWFLRQTSCAERWYWGCGIVQFPVSCPPPPVLHVVLTTLCVLLVCQLGHCYWYWTPSHLRDPLSDVFSLCAIVSWFYSPSSEFMCRTTTLNKQTGRNVCHEPSKRLLQWTKELQLSPNLNLALRGPMEASNNHNHTQYKQL